MSEHSASDVTGSVRDFLGPVLALDRGRFKLRWLAGVSGALCAHGLIAAFALTAMIDLQRYAEAIRAETAAKLRMEIDVNVAEPEPEPEPPPPEPEAPPEPVLPQPVTPPPQNVPKAEDPEPPPPAAAQAGNVLTADPDPNEPVDLTDQGFVTGNGDSYVGGTTAAAGTSKTAVYDRRAQATGVGSAPPGPVSPLGGRDLSRKPEPLNKSWNDCGFPAEADMEQINQARVTIAVTVAADGSAKSVTVIKDPGYGFGQLARRCASRRRFHPALDAQGRAVTATTTPFTIKFIR